MRLRSCQDWRDIRRAGAVAAANPVLSQQPSVAGPGDRLIGDFRDAVRIRQTARLRIGQDGFELIRLEADQAEIEVGELERLQFVAEPLCGKCLYEFETNAGLLVWTTTPTSR